MGFVLKPSLRVGLVPRYYAATHCEDSTCLTILLQMRL